MSAFSYIALDLQGRRKKGVLEGDTARQVRQKLRDQRLTPLEVSEISQHTVTKKSFYLVKRVKTADLSLMTRQMSTLLSAGIPLE